MGKLLSTQLAEQILVDPTRRDVMEAMYRDALRLEQQVETLHGQLEMLATELAQTKAHRNQLFNTLTAATIPPPGA